MEFAIRLGDRYLHKIIVGGGQAGHSALCQLDIKGITTSGDPYWFDALSAGNKVKAVIELMRYRDIEAREVVVEARE